MNNDTIRSCRPLTSERHPEPSRQECASAAKLRQSDKTFPDSPASGRSKDCPPGIRRVQHRLRGTQVGPNCMSTPRSGAEFDAYSCPSSAASAVRGKRCGEEEWCPEKSTPPGKDKAREDAIRNDDARTFPLPPLRIPGRGRRRLRVHLRDESEGSAFPHPTALHSRKTERQYVQRRPIITAKEDDTAAFSAPPRQAGESADSTFTGQPVDQNPDSLQKKCGSFRKKLHTTPPADNNFSKKFPIQKPLQNALFSY